jgi:hypothetical protein
MSFLACPRRFKAGRQKGQAMRHKLAALTGGLALAFTFAIPAAANAATVRASSPAIARADAGQVCDLLTDAGTNGVSDLNDQNNLVFAVNSMFQMEFCNVLAVNSSTGYIDEDSAAACLSNGGDGDTWDRWTATKETQNGHTFWEFQNQFASGDCIYDDEQVPAIYAACSGSDHFEWFSWNTGL